MPVSVVFRCEICGARPDPGTQVALERQLLDLRHGEYVDADPGRWLTGTGAGSTAHRYACGEHRGELKAAVREQYGTLGWHPWAIGPHPWAGRRGTTGPGSWRGGSARPSGRPPDSHARRPRHRHREHARGAGPGRGRDQRRRRQHRRRHLRRPARRPSSTSSSPTPRRPGTRWPSPPRGQPRARGRRGRRRGPARRPRRLTRKIARAGVDLDLVYVATRNRVVFGAPDLDALRAAVG